MWQEALGVDYKPIVDVRKVKPKKANLTEQQTIMDAVRETAKYMVKAVDLVGECKPIDQEWLLGLTDQLHGIKQMNLSGIFRKYIKPHEPDEAEILEAGEDYDPENVSRIEQNTSFNWFRSISHYARKVPR